MTTDVSDSKTKNNESKKSIDSSHGLSHNIYIAVYKYYQELALNEDRLFNERLMVFLTSQSILFLGFIMCFQVQYDIFHIVGIFLSLVGIALCVFAFLLTNPAWKTWEKWQKELTGIEVELKKDLIKKGKVDLVFPFEARCEIEKRRFCSGEWPWWIGCCAIPLTFLLLWVFSLVCSLHIIISAMFFC